MRKSASACFNSHYIACDSNKELYKTITEPNIPLLPLTDSKKLYTFSIPAFNLECPNIREIMESFLSFGDADNFDKWKWNGESLPTMKDAEECKAPFVKRKRILLTDSIPSGGDTKMEFKCSKNDIENTHSATTDVDYFGNEENEPVLSFVKTESLEVNQHIESVDNEMEQKILEETVAASNGVINGNNEFERVYYEIMESSIKVSSMVGNIPENLSHKSVSEENIFRTDTTELEQSATLNRDEDFSSSDSDLLSHDYSRNDEENNERIAIDLYNQECLNHYSLSTSESDLEIEDHLKFDFTNFTQTSVDSEVIVDKEKDYELFPMSNGHKNFENINTQIYFQSDYQEPIDFSNLCFHEEYETSLDPDVLWVNSHYFNSIEHFITAGNAEETEDDASSETMMYLSQLQDLRRDTHQIVNNKEEYDLCERINQCNVNDTCGINKGSVSFGDNRSQSEQSFRSISSNYTSIYDERYFGRSDVFHPLLTSSEQKMIGLKSTYSNNLIFNDAHILETVDPNGMTNWSGGTDEAIGWFNHNDSEHYYKNRKVQQDSLKCDIVNLLLTGQLIGSGEATIGVHNDLVKPNCVPSISQSVEDHLSCILELANTCTVSINEFLQEQDDQTKCENPFSSDVCPKTENLERNKSLKKLKEAHDFEVKEQLSYISGIVHLCNDNIKELLESLQRSRSYMNGTPLIQASKIDFREEDDSGDKNVNIDSRPKTPEESNSVIDVCNKSPINESCESKHSPHTNEFKYLSKITASNCNDDINKIWNHVKIFQYNNRSLKQQKKLLMTNIKKKFKCKSNNVRTVNNQQGKEDGINFKGESKEDLMMQTIKHLHLAELEYKKNKETLITDKIRGKVRNFLFVNMISIDSLKIEYKKKIDSLKTEFNKKQVKAELELRKKFQHQKCKMYSEACKMEKKFKRERQSFDRWLSNEKLCLSKAILDMSLTEEYGIMHDTRQEQ